jgi:hypothetical protein
MFVTIISASNILFEFEFVFLFDYQLLIEPKDLYTNFNSSKIELYADSAIKFLGVTN